MLCFIAQGIPVVNAVLNLRLDSTQRSTSPLDVAAQPKVPAPGKESRGDEATCTAGRRVNLGASGRPTCLELRQVCMSSSHV
jgi:hypothetical protein